MIRGSLLPPLTALAILVGSGFAQRHWSRDPVVRQALDEARQRVATCLPETLGSWKGREAEIDQRGLDRAGIVGLAARRYRRERDGAEVTVVLICGMTGPIAAHGPESCYPGLGYNPIAPARRIHLEGTDGNLWSADFQGETDGVERQLHILWSWNDGRRWAAPDNPRPYFAAAPALYKLYVIHESESDVIPAQNLAAEVMAILNPNRRPTQK